MLEQINWGAVANHKSIRKAILKSQHCQRNFDLSQAMPEEDIKLLKTAISQCPSKQNVAFYKAHFIFDRKIIEEIHSFTSAEIAGSDPVRYRSNPQVLGNLLVVFEEKSGLEDSDSYHKHRNSETKALSAGTATKEQIDILKTDRDTAIGIAAGYLNLTASLLGYATGCCSCFDTEKVKSMLNLKNEPRLLMGIGFKDISRNRREHHLVKNYLISPFRKQPIEIVTLGSQMESVAATQTCS